MRDAVPHVPSFVATVPYGVAAVTEAPFALQLKLYLKVQQILHTWTGAYRETQKGGGRILRKINSFCKILSRISQKEGAKDRRPPPLHYAYDMWHEDPDGKAGAVPKAPSCVAAYTLARLLRLYYGLYLVKFLLWQRSTCVPE